MHTRSKDPHGKGFREVEVVQDLQIVATKSTEELIMELIEKQSLPSFLIAKRLGISPQTIDNALRRMVNKGMLKRQNATIQGKTRRQPCILFSKL